MNLPPSLKRYVLAVSLTGAGLFAWTVLAHGGQLVERLSPTVVLLAVAIVLAECFPVHLPRGEDEDEITTSSTFTFGLLLLAGLPAAVVAQVGASVVADIRTGKTPVHIVFNAAQYTIVLAAAAALLTALTPVPRAGELPIAPVDLPAIALSGAVYFLLNVLLVAVAVAFAERRSIRRTLAGEHWASNVWTYGMLLSLTPLVVLIDGFTPLLLPVLAFPVLLVFRTGRQALDTQHQALHDSLTGLPNRALFLDRVDQAVLAARRDGGSVAVMLMDLDRFKEINDTLGHHRGDELLRQIGPRLEAVLRDSDTVARLGGDEFAILLRAGSTLMGAEIVAHRLLECLQEPLFIDGVRLEVSGSIGIACYPEHGNNIDDLLQRADVAMYQAKEARSGFEFYSADMDAHSADRLALMSELREALRGGELTLAYQPKIDLATGAPAGAEALARWMHPERGAIPPPVFIEHAEQTGLIHPLTMFVLDTALTQVARWRRQGVELPVSVNLSTRSLLDRDLPRHVARLLRSHDLQPEMLILEITESTLMADPMRAKPVIEELSAMGVELSIDDFGTGYSSLGHLRTLPVHELKIDRSFVMSMDTEQQDATIVRSTIGLARNLGLRVVAEGIESMEIAGQLREMGCHQGQGYGFARPMPGHDVAEWAATFSLPLAA